jgi:hypothetical protein
MAIIRLILCDCDVEGRSSREGRVTWRKSNQRVRCDSFLCETLEPVELAAYVYSDVLLQVVGMYETSAGVARIMETVTIAPPSAIAGHVKEVEWPRSNQLWKAAKINTCLYNLPRCVEAGTSSE